jgi:MoxR-like ATPase
VKPVLGAEDLARFQDVVLGINAAPALVRYAVEVATRTRPVTAAAPRMVKDYVAWGAGPRASQYLILGAKARAALLGRTHVSHDDIDALAPAVLGHRVLVNFQAEAERIGARDVVAEVLRSASSSR